MTCIECMKDTLRTGYMVQEERLLPAEVQVPLVPHHVSVNFFVALMKVKKSSKTFLQQYGTIALSD